jgi:1-acyl-sn-glycerol-3-phosphate acyltransferase
MSAGDTPGLGPQVLQELSRPFGTPSRLARWILSVFGWRLDATGLPADQGVILVYPHTSNWDFPIGVLTKWALGFEARFWAKDSLFKLPLVGRWMRYIGGIAVVRSSSQGLVGDTVGQMQAARERGERFWLVAAPEGTRSQTPGWRTGAYQVAVQAGVPLGLAYFDFKTRVIGVEHFLKLTGDIEADFAAFRAYLAHRQGCRPEQASPIQPFVRP